MRPAVKPVADRFAATFARLRRMLAGYADQFIVSVDRLGDYQLCSPVLKDRTGRPLFFAGIQIKKNYVSYHLLPLYMNPEFQKRISPALRKRMQGKACFNFTEISPAQVTELAELTREGIEVFKGLKLPWDRARQRNDGS